MTPLAAAIFTNKCDRVDMEAFDDTSLLEAQFFEVSDCAELINNMAWDIIEGKQSYDLSDTFLPSEPTWIEWHFGQRNAWLLWTKAGVIHGQFFFGHTKDWAQAVPEKSLFSELSAKPIIHPLIAWGMPRHEDQVLAPEVALDLHELVFAAVALGLINSPRIIGRRQIMPNRRLERELLKRNGKAVGKFPLQAWTEILLKVAAPKDMSNEGAVDAHLTGRKAMHFCRAHLRLRLGRVEVVRGHWRGDPALGVKRSRYILEQ